jgi:alpha-galactosidase
LAQAREHVRLNAGGVTLVLALERGGAADLVYLGSALPGVEDLAALAAAQARAAHESQPDARPFPGLLPQHGRGWTGSPALALTRAGKAIATDLLVTGWRAAGDHIGVDLTDERAGIGVSVSWALGEDGMLDCATRITNTGDAPLSLDRLASLALPVPSRFTEVTSFAGRWAGEMRESRRTIAPEGFARASAIGKQGFGGGNWLLLHDPVSGEVLGAHLEWSGDYDTRLEPDNQGAADGRSVLLMGAAWEPGEVVLGPGESFETCGAILAHGTDRDDLAQRFHRHLRGCVLPFDAARAPRRVHLNSWEALSFDLSEPELFELAESAAALGAERFVLDDGWFSGRRDATSSLGDWSVSEAVFPNGLGPLIAHVKALGMDFGLWVEPEMVSPDSELYRAHPDWCLVPADGDRPTMRGQLVLDLQNPEVQKALYGWLHDLLRRENIAYLKWDHNRDLFPRGGRGHGQTQALYGILKDLRAAFPLLEIETCSSGGGRIDTQILTYTHRCWPSDNNDAIERLRIMRSWAQFLPLEVLGSHVGPSPNPITGRRLGIDFRAKVALFGHMGVEADPRRMEPGERAVLAAHIALYKQWRGVLHEGALWRLDHPDPGVSGMMAVHGPRALALVAQTGFAAAFDAAPVRLAGLEPEGRYRVTLPQPWPDKAARYLAGPDGWHGGLVLSGAALMRQGLALPLTHPETAWLVALERLEA